MSAAEQADPFAGDWYWNQVVAGHSPYDAVTRPAPIPGPAIVHDPVGVESDVNFCPGCTVGRGVGQATRVEDGVYGENQGLWFRWSNDAGNFSLPVRVICGELRDLDADGIVAARDVVEGMILRCHNPGERRSFMSRVATCGAFGCRAGQTPTVEVSVEPTPQEPEESGFLMDTYQGHRDTPGM